MPLNQSFIGIVLLQELLDHPDFARPFQRFGDDFITMRLAGPAFGPIQFPAHDHALSMHNRVLCGDVLDDGGGLCRVLPPQPFQILLRDLRLRLCLRLLLLRWPNGSFKIRKPSLQFLALFALIL